MRESFVSDTADNIFSMSVEEKALLLRHIGIRCYQFPCMTETNIRRVARNFNKQSGYNSARGFVSTLELLLKELEAGDPDA